MTTRPTPESGKPRIVSVLVRDPSEQTDASPHAGRIKVEPITADVVRTIARHYGKTIDQLVQEMLHLYVSLRCEDLKLVTLGESVETIATPTGERASDQER